MLLAIDVGNTNTVLGVYKKNKLIHDWRIRTVKNSTADEFSILVNTLFMQGGLNCKNIKKTIISSVVSETVSILDSFCEKHLQLTPVWVNASMLETIMPVKYHDPSEVGPDRLVNAIAAYEKHQCGLIIIDLGTATTFDAVSAHGEFLGGAIAPGIAISSQALTDMTSRLPKIQLSDPPENIIAKNTVDSIKSGILHGSASMVDGMVAKMIKEIGEPVKIIATGGLAPLISVISSTIDCVESSLTLEGLQNIASRL